VNTYDDYRRCTPGRKTVDRSCNAHPVHHWCAACEGFYGVPHDYGCHTKEVKAGRGTNPNPGQCACRFCQVAKAENLGAAYQRFEPVR
jgi:hypothetical protein